MVVSVTTSKKLQPFKILA